MKAGLTYTQEGRIFKNVRAMQSEQMFNHILQAATAQGLQVNSKKTSLLAISGARGYRAATHIYDTTKTRIDSEGKPKVLGFLFDEEATVSEQVESLIRKINIRIWTLRELAGSGFNEKERLQVYTTMLRPIIEYSSVVYNSMLTAEQEEELERVQTRALKSIYGHVYSGTKLLEMSGLRTLKERREAASLKFAIKTSENPRFAGWFPK